MKHIAINLLEIKSECLLDLLTFLTRLNIIEYEFFDLDDYEGPLGDMGEYYSAYRTIIEEMFL